VPLSDCTVHLQHCQPKTAEELPSSLVVGFQDHPGLCGWLCTRVYVCVFMHVCAFCLVLSVECSVFSVQCAVLCVCVCLE
jgi:hypothetical protein